MTIFKRFLIFSWLCLGAGWLYAGACWGAGAGNSRDTVKYPPFVYLKGTDTLFEISSEVYRPFAAIRFQSMQTGEIIKEIQVRDNNPYLSIGLEPASMSLSGLTSLHSSIEIGKLDVKSVLPSYLYDELQTNWGLDTGIVAVTLTGIGQYMADLSAYTTVMYWLEIAPMDERVFLGNYAVTTVSVWDTLGQEVLRHQFDGILDAAMMSNDGQYLITTHMQYPEDLRLPAGERDKSRFARYLSVIKVPEMEVIWQDSALTFNTEYYFRNSQHAPQKVEIVMREHPRGNQKLWVFDTSEKRLFGATPSADWQPFAFKVSPDSITYTAVHIPEKVMTVELMNLSYKKL